MRLARPVLIDVMLCSSETAKLANAMYRQVDPQVSARRNLSMALLSCSGQAQHA